MEVSDILDEAGKYQNICNIFGIDWIETEVRRHRERNHPIIWMLSEAGRHIKTGYTLSFLDECIGKATQLLLKDGDGNKKLVRLESKLKNDDSFWDTFAELEWILYLNDKCPRLVIEPSFPEMGPDILSTLCKRGINIEVKSLKSSEYEIEQDKKFYEISKRIKKIESRFFVMVRMIKEMNNQEQNWLIKDVIGRLNRYDKMESVEPISVYYFSKGNVQEWFGYDGLTPPDDVYTNMAKYPLFYKEKEAMCIIIFIPSKNKKGTTISYSGEARLMNDDVRVDKAIRKKLKQLGKEYPAIVVLDVTFSTAGGLDIMGALYGNWSQDKNGFIIIRKDLKPNNAIFNERENTRISAIVMNKRRQHGDGRIVHERIVFPNPYATNPLSDNEIDCLGVPVSRVKDKELN